MNGWPEGGPAPVPDGFEAGGKARPPRNGAESFPEAERCRAKGCAARKARHGVGRCEEHFRTLCDFYGHTPNRNREPTRWRRVQRALAARAKAADAIGGAGKAATPDGSPDARSGPVCLTLGDGEPFAEECFAAWRATESGPLAELDEATCRRCLEAYRDENRAESENRLLNAGDRTAAARDAIRADARLAELAADAASGEPAESGPDGWPVEDVKDLRAMAARQLRDTVRGFSTYGGRKFHRLIPDPENPGGPLIRKGSAGPLTVWRAIRDALRGAGIPEGVVSKVLPPRPEVDRRPEAIIPRFLEVGAHVEGRDRLPPFDSAEGAQGSLPGFEVSRPGLVPAFPLPVERNPFQGAPIWQRLAFETVVAARIEGRRPEYEPVPVTLQDLIDFAGWEPFRPGRHIPQIATAFDRMRNWSIYHERRAWYPLAPLADPTTATRRGDMLPIQVAIPPGMAPGPMVERAFFRTVAKESAAGWRALARLNLFWHRYSPSGRLIRATVPEVRRDAGGQIVDAHGRPLTPRRGRPPHWSDPRAIRTGARTGNPGAVRVPVFTPGDLVALGFDGAEVSRQLFAKRLRGARKALAALERAGRLAIDRSATDKRGRKGWRILLP